MTPIIECRGLSKRYKLGVLGHETDSFREYLLQIARAPLALIGRKGNRDKQAAEEHIWALKDINFEVEEGSVVGIVGGNGAGKSTLLKILSRITDPTEGEVIIRGRLASLLEVGTGFHPELTGRENVYLNGAILGMRREEIAAKFDEIVAFSEIERFLDTPVKRYSSGMYVRLAFAVAAHLDPEILVIDEVLAVGDVAFQKKCIGKMSDVSRSGRTVLFVSHNMAAVESLCESGMVLDTGRITFEGSVQESIDHYLNQLMSRTQSSSGNSFDLSDAHRVNSLSRHKRRLKKLELLSDEGQLQVGGVQVGAPLTIAIDFVMEKMLLDFEMTLSFETLFGHTVLETSTLFEPETIMLERVGDQRLSLRIPSLTLVPGEYRLKITFKSRGILVDMIEDAARVSILPGNYYGSGNLPKKGSFVLEHDWTLE